MRPKRGASTPAAPASGDRSDFATLLTQGIDQVNQSEQSASAARRCLGARHPGVDLAQVMVREQKARVSFRALTEVRNRLVSAYQDIMNMSM